jgi:thiol-disulfide isomerase/thioredoxin
MKLLRVLAAGVVAALAGVLVWHLTHQPASVARAVAKHRIVAAPDFTLARLAGNGKVSLRALRGKAVVVNFWASYCGPCKSETPRLASFARRWSGKSVVVVGIDVMEHAKGPGRAFARRYGATYPLAFDPSGSTVDPWGIGQGTPQTFFVDRRGRIVQHVLGEVTTATLESGVRRALRS